MKFSETLARIRILLYEVEAYLKRHSKEFFEKELEKLSKGRITSSYFFMKEVKNGKVKLILKGPWRVYLKRLATKEEIKEHLRDMEKINIEEEYGGWVHFVRLEKGKRYSKEELEKMPTMLGYFVDEDLYYTRVIAFLRERLRDSKD